MLMSLPAFAGGGTVKEKETGRSFESELKGSKGTLVCIGTGCREKTWLAVDVYAAAHWVDAGALSKELGAWKGKSGAAVASDQKFFDALAKADSEKRLRMLFVRSVAVKKIRDAFEESLLKSYKTLPAVAKAFVALFQKDLKDGTTIELRSLPGGLIEVYLDGKLTKKFAKDRAFATAIWNIWFQADLADDYLKKVKVGLVAELAKIWKK